MQKLGNSVRNIFRTSILALTLAFLSLGANNILSANAEKIPQNAVSECCDKIQDTEKKSEKVFITKTGKCYHHGKCRHLKHSKIELEITIVEKNDYEPCSKCHGENS